MPLLALAFAGSTLFAVHAARLASHDSTHTIAQDAPHAPPVPAADAPAKFGVGSDAPPLNVQRWLRGKPVTRFESGKIHVVHFLTVGTESGPTHLPTFAYLQGAYGARVRFVGVTSPDHEDDVDELKRTLDARPDLFTFPIAWDGTSSAKEDYVSAARVQTLPHSFVIDDKRRIAFIGMPHQVDGVLGDMLSGKFDPALGAERAERAIHLLGELHHGKHRDFEARLTLIDEFCQLHGFADMFRGVRFSALTQLGRCDEAAQLAAPLVEYASAYKNGDLLNEIAWMYVSPDNQMKSRDLKLALRAALRAVEVTASEDGYFLDTLAHCQWRNGEIDQAIASFELALGLIAESDVKADVEQSLAKCRAERALRDEKAKTGQK